jgi:hypothetical protein
MNPTPFVPCLHCERAPQEHYLRLCQKCAGKQGIRRLYKKTKTWTPGWDAHLQCLVARANANLPLFDDELAKENRHEKIEEARSA